MGDHGDHGASEKKEFGKEVGLMSEVIVTGRKVGANHEFWSTLAHNQALFKKVVDFVEDYATLIVEWEKFYREVFGMEANFSNLRIPEHKKGFDRLIILAKGMTPQRLFDKCQELFPSRKWVKVDSLDKEVISERIAKEGPYAVWFRNRTEADNELKNLSADTLRDRGIAGITLEESLLYELKYFKETGEHLDVSNGILCSGSRYRDGYVPYVKWEEGWLLVSWAHPHDESLCSRAAVS